MGEYLRVTRECTLDGMHPALAAAIRAYVEKYKLEDVGAAALMCCETTSTKQKKKLFSRKAEVVLTGVVLTPKRLIWATGEEGKDLGVLMVKLSDAQVEDHEKSSLAGLSSYLS